MRSQFVKILSMTIERGCQSQDRASQTLNKDTSNNSLTTMFSEAFMLRAKSWIRVEANQDEMIQTRLKTIEDIGRYLSLVPIGQRKKEYRKKSIGQKMREKLFEERGRSCEACNCCLDSFEIHHTNYDQFDNPAYLKIVCKPCHEIINIMTGLVNWYENLRNNKQRPREMITQDSDKNILSESKDIPITRISRTSIIES